MVDASAFGRFLVIPIGVGWFWAISDYFMIYTIWFMIYAIYSFQLYSYHLKDLFLGNFLNYWFFQSLIFISSTYTQTQRIKFKEIMCLEVPKFTKKKLKIKNEIC